jgi:hypothetical protein
LFFRLEFGRLVAVLTRTKGPELERQPIDKEKKQDVEDVTPTGK